MYRPDPILSSSPPSPANPRSTSPDELAANFVTQQTMPWNAQSSHVALPSMGTTQPTQILDTPPKLRAHVQVARSSPAPDRFSSPPMSQIPQSQTPRGLMAPPGTYTLLPQPVAPPRVIDLVSDDPPVEPDSEEEEDTRGSNIRPSEIEMRSASVVGETPPQKSSFGFNVSGYAYNPNANGKRPIYSSSSPPQKKFRPAGPQSGPSRAIPVAPELQIKDIPDNEMQMKVRRLKAIAPQKTVEWLYRLLMNNDGDYERSKNAVEQESSEDELLPGVMLTSKPLTAVPSYQPKKTAQRGLNAPIQTIQEKFSRHRYSLPQEVASPEKPKKRRLVRGRHPTPEASPQKVIEVSSDEDEGIKVVDDDDDSDASSEEEVDLDQEGLLEFFNTCSVSAMVDLSNQKEEDIKSVLDQRPFSSLAQIEKIHAALPEINDKGKKPRKPKTPFGKRLVDSASSMWSGFGAVDQLVKQCKDRGKPIAVAMATWGVDVFGASTDGELALTSLDSLNDSNSARDSGIGTPSGVATPDGSHAGDLDVDLLRRNRKSKTTTLLKKPENMSKDIELKDYQLVGLNWLNLLWENGVSGILADDMGLGKTCQVIAFLSHLKQSGVPGPHLIVVPGSTLENWLREFENFSPELKKHVEPYYGLQQARYEQQDLILQNISDVYVIVTTYDLAYKPSDNKFLRQCRPQSCIYDEGHVLRNSETQRYKALMKIPAKFRLLLTGTPLQNSLRELASILAFIMPDIFSEVKDNLEVVFKHKAKVNEADTHETLLSTQRIQRAKSMMTPFILRRKKFQVLKHLPKKTCRVEYCDLTETQSKIYSEQLERQKQVFDDRAAGIQTKEHANVMMKLRQAALHPMLFRAHYNDTTIRKMAKAALKEPTFQNSDPSIIYEELELYQDYQCHQLATKYPTHLGKFAMKKDEWMDSGKVQKLAELLKTYVQNGDRTLIFSQFTSVMDILQWVLDTLDISYSRLDGQTPIVERQALLDQFYDDESINVFMLSTKSGGAGINLACANKVVIFDSSFNPQDDIQAENRAHRVGQMREVEVVRLVTRGTVEEQIHALGMSKLELDKMVSGEEEGKKGISAGEEVGMRAVEVMLLRDMEKGGESEEREKEKGGDVKDEFLASLKATGLDLEAA